MSVSNALERAVAGLQVVSSTGQPGEDANIYVRGIGSLSAGNAALIVVDGVPFNGRLSDINPNDIESITVSKDAVSNSLYGSRIMSVLIIPNGAKVKNTIIRRIRVSLSSLKRPKETSQEVWLTGFTPSC